MALADAPIDLDPRDPLPFVEAIEWHAQQAPWISGSSWATMTDLAALKGEEASAAAALGMLEDVWKEIDRSVAEGLPYSDFVRDLGDKLKLKWFDVDSPRLRLIVHNNVGNALMAGRFAQMEHPDVLADRPVWVFDGIEDFRQSDICQARDGVVLPAADPWWQRNRPLLHHNCRSSIIAIPEEEADDFGGTTPAGSLADLPDVQEGWGAPSAWGDWKPKAADYHPALFEEYERWVGGQDYLRTKSEWDEAWHALVAPAVPRDTPTAPVIEITPLEDPAATVTWGKEPEHEGALIGSKPLTPVGYSPDTVGFITGKVWNTFPDKLIAEPPPPAGKVSSGIIVVEDDGRIWIIEPKDHFGGYERTFPKGGKEPGLTLQQTAVKEVWEETGLLVDVQGYVGDFKGTTGTTRYYWGGRVTGAPWKSGPETATVTLCSQETAAGLLNTVRDQEVLKVLQARLSGEAVPSGLKTYVQPPAPKWIVEKKTQAPAAAPPSVGDGHPYGLDPSRYVYAAAKGGGSTPGLIVEHPDAPGRRFLVKQLEDKIKADAEVSGSALYGLVSDDIVGAMPLDAGQVPAGVRGRGRYLTIQEMRAGTQSLASLVGWKSAPDFNGLTSDQQAQLLAHGIASWSAGEHDGHVDQYLVDAKTGDLIRIDFGQALKYTTMPAGDKLALDYHPNAQYGEAKPAHLQLLEAVRDGKIDKAVLKHPAVKAAVDRAAKLKGAQIQQAIERYAANRPGGMPAAALRKLLLARAKNAKGDWAALFSEVTGEDFRWKGTRRPKVKPVAEPPPPRRARSVPEIVRGVDLQTAAPVLKTHGATTLAADGDVLRSQAWRVQEQTVEGRAQLAFTGELDQQVWPQVQRALSASGATSTSWTSRRRQRASPVLKLEGSPSAFLGRARVKETSEYRITWGDPTTASEVQKGQFRVEVFTSDPAEARKVFVKALRDAGLDARALTTPPSPDDAEKARLARALWNIEGGKFRAPLSVEEARRRLRSYGEDPEAIEIRQNALGYNEPRIPGRGEGYRRQGLRMAYHQFGATSAAVRGISGGDGGHGGLLSTVARTENGIVASGMSSSADLATGGASSVFTRLVGAPSSDAGRAWYSNYKPAVILSPKMLDRLDWYGYSADEFGRVTGSAFTNRKGADAHVAAMIARGGRSNETMLRNAVDREDILLFAAPSREQRDTVLRELRAAGVRTIRGQPVEEMVVLMRTPSDYSNLKASNPVHAYLMGRAEDYPPWDERYEEVP